MGLCPACLRFVPWSFCLRLPLDALEPNPPLRAVVGALLRPMPLASFKRAITCSQREDCCAILRPKVLRGMVRHCVRETDACGPRLKVNVPLPSSVAALSILV